MLKRTLAALTTFSMIATAQCASITGPGPFPSPIETATAYEAQPNLPTAPPLAVLG